MDSKVKDTQYILKKVLVMCVSAIFLSSALTLLEWLLDNVPLMRICSPFIDPTNELVIVKVTTFTVVALQLLSVVFIVTMYRKLLVSVQKSQSNIQHAVSKQRSNTPLVVQIFVVTGSNILCWIPSGAFYLTSLFVKEYPIDVIFWMTIGMNPVNSIVNPIVFIVTSLRK